MAKRTRKKAKKTVTTLTHEDASRKNIPTAELESVVREEDQKPVRATYQREAKGLDKEKASRNRDLDPQLIWRGKDQQDWSDLVVHAPPLYIQEKVHPKVLIDDLMRRTREQERAEVEQAKPSLFPDMFADFNGLPDHARSAEFYQHDANWTNRMILGDSLQVMASLAEREGLRGQVQCIYIDPPYGIKFNSNFQWSTTSRDVKDGNVDHITREPEQVKAFRDTWRDGIHSYLTYLRDRITVARDLLHESGSIFVQIGDENVHRVRALLDEVLGEGNFVAQITFRVKSPLQVADLARTTNFIVWYARQKTAMKFRQARVLKTLESHPEFSSVLLSDGSVCSRSTDRTDSNARYFTAQNLGSSGYTQSCMYQACVDGRVFSFPRGKSWKTHQNGMKRLLRASRLHPLRTSLRWRYFFDDAPSEVIDDVWQDTFAASDKTYVVQTSAMPIQRCILMVTDPGDLVLDPTCGSGTSAYVAEQWGRRWITVDTSRVALALARARIMGARYPYYLLADSKEGVLREAQLTRTDPPDDLDTRHYSANIRQGFVYERVPHITLKSIANNAEIDVIWENWQPVVEKALAEFNAALRGHDTPFKATVGGRAGTEIDFTAPQGSTIKLPSGEDAPANGLLEWEVPRQAPDGWPEAAKEPLEAFWKARFAWQEEIDASIASKADFEYLYDRPYADSSKVRVAGPFTVESLSPHRVLGVDENGELIDPQRTGGDASGDEESFVQMILENLKTAGVQQAHKEDKIDFMTLEGWPGRFVCAVGRYTEGNRESGATKRAGIFIGPEFGTVSRQDLVLAAREAGDADFDVLIACAFSYDAHSSEFKQLGRIPVLKARMNADLHMADDLKNTGKGNLFVIFGEPDIDILDAEDGQIRVKINGVDVFHPNTGEVRSDGAEGIACWFIDTDYNGESFFVRHAYFLGANDPYKSLKTTLKTEINAEAWETLRNDASRPFGRPEGGRIAVKVINHLGDEVMKVFRVG